MKYQFVLTERSVQFLSQLVKEGNVFMRVMNYDRNEGLLRKVPFKRIFDLAAVPFIRLGNTEDGELNAPVTHEFLQSSGLSEAEIFRTAEDSFKESDYLFCDLWEYFETVSFKKMNGKLLEAEQNKHRVTNYLEEGNKPVMDKLIDTFMITTWNGLYGSNAMYHMSLLEKVREKIGEYYILPASKMQLIFVPKTPFIDVDELLGMVGDINPSLTEDEFLSDSIYEFTEEGLSVARQAKAA